MRSYAVDPAPMDIRVQFSEKFTASFRAGLSQTLLVEEEVDPQIRFGDCIRVHNGKITNAWWKNMAVSKCGCLVGCIAILYREGLDSSRLQRQRCHGHS